MTPVKIIAADDESGVLFLLGSIINKLDNVELVGMAKNASDTLRLVKERKPDLALLDIQLPDMKGIELAEKLRELKPDLYIVFITAHKEYSLEAFHLYAYDYILKPIDTERLGNIDGYLPEPIFPPTLARSNDHYGIGQRHPGINRRYIRSSPCSAFHLKSRTNYL